MKLFVAVLSALAIAGATGCARDDRGLQEKLDSIDQRLAKIEGALGEGGGAAARARPTRRRPPGPDAKAVYAVPIEGAAYEGPEVAAITIVEAFDFA